MECAEVRKRGTPSVLRIGNSREREKREYPGADPRHAALLDLERTLRSGLRFQPEPKSTIFKIGLIKIVATAMIRVETRTVGS
jgi:hypothetical protein